MSNLIPKSDSRQRPTSNEPVNCTSKADRGLDLKTTIVAEKCVIKPVAIKELWYVSYVLTTYVQYIVTGWCKIAAPVSTLQLRLYDLQLRPGRCRDVTGLIRRPGTNFYVS